MVVKDLALEMEEEAGDEASAEPSKEPLAESSPADGEEPTEPEENEAPEELKRQQEVIAAQEGRIAELEETLAGLQMTLEEREETVSALTTQLEEARGRLEALQGEASAREEQLALAVAKYRTAALAATPDVPEELVVGTTVAEVDDSLSAARQTVENVRSRLRIRAAAERVPAGAPVRGAPDLSALSSKEKIALGLEGRR